MSKALYWTIVGLLIGFGFIAILSIGAPFFLLGLTMAVLYPFRERRGVLATGVSALVAFVVGYVLIAPLTCTGTSTAVDGSGSGSVTSVTRCSNVLGIAYRGGEGYSPSILPAMAAGVALAALVGFIVFGLLRSRGRASAQAVR